MRLTTLHTHRMFRSARCTARAPSTGTTVGVALTALLLGGYLWPRSSLVLIGGRGVDDFSLYQPMRYLAMAPVARLLDELSLLSAEQHVTLLASLALLCVARAVFVSRRRRDGFAIPCIVRACIVPLVATVGTYLAGAVIPRPMLALQASNPSDLLVDFHSHTSRSHDGRPGWDAESNRAWHSAAGFDAAYITDHQTMASWQTLAGVNARSRPSLRALAGVVAAVTPGPSRVVLLPGVESVVPGAHLSLLGVQTEDGRLFRHARDLDTLAFARIDSTNRPVVVLTLPYSLTRPPERLPAVDAIEISDGAPRGLGFSRAHRAQIIGLADSLGVPLVASSNNHGWGSTAVAWTVLHVEGWRTLPPRRLEARIRDVLRRHPNAVRVVERSAVGISGGWGSRLTLIPRLGLHIARVLSPRERLAFGVWIWGLWLWGIPLHVRGRRAMDRA